MLSTDPYTRAVSPLIRRMLGGACLAVALASGVAALLTEDGVMIVFAVVVGAPVGLVGLSLMAGKAAQGRGVLSPVTLYAVGVLIIAASVGMSFAGEPRAALVSVFSLACFRLARRRSGKRERW